VPFTCEPNAVVNFTNTAYAKDASIKQKLRSKVVSQFVAKPPPSITLRRMAFFYAIRCDASNELYCMFKIFSLATHFLADVKGTSSKHPHSPVLVPQHGNI
jgi:hypothetical protein